MSLWTDSNEALAKVLNNNVAANFSLRVLFYFNMLQTQAVAPAPRQRGKPAATLRPPTEIPKQY